MSDPLIFLIIGTLLGAAAGIALASLRGARILRDAERRSALADAESAAFRQQEAQLRQDAQLARERLEAEQAERVAAQTRAGETEKRLKEQLQLLEEAKAQLQDAFKSLAADALAQNNKGFLTLAEEKFKALKDDTRSDLKARQEAIESLVKPVTETLKAYQQQTQQLEKERREQQGTFSEQLRALAQQQQSLQTETTKLTQALSSSQRRGRWGEIALRRIVELAGMTKYCDFVEQAAAQEEQDRGRPDMIVRLPGGREVIVDSKVPLTGFWDALEATNDADREQCLKRHARHVSQRVTELASKSYWTQFQQAPEFVVLFIPNDSFLAAAAEQDAELIEKALACKVVIATPTTLIALLRAIAYGWRQEQMAENAKAVSQIGQELYDRLATLVEHLNRVGGALNKSVDAYNAALSSFDHRVIPGARKFKELGIAGKKDLTELVYVDNKARSLPAGENGEETLQVTSDT